MRIRTALITTLACAALMTGCRSTTVGGDDGHAAPDGGADQRTGVMSAEQVTEELENSVPTVKLKVAYTEATDPNHRMGRPHQYVSKTAFADSRVPAAKAAEDSGGRKDAIGYGGTVEVFATKADAKAWVDSIDREGRADDEPASPDYLFRSGRYVIRVSRHLNALQAADYGTFIVTLG